MRQLSDFVKEEPAAAEPCYRTADPKNNSEDSHNGKANMRLIHGVVESLVVVMRWMETVHKMHLDLVLERECEVEMRSQSGVRKAYTECDRFFVALAARMPICYALAIMPL